jgi:hypothetical protein
VIAEPATALEGLCRGLGLSSSPGYLAACSRIVFESPRRTRDTVAWTPELLALVADRTDAIPPFARYRLDAPLAPERAG